MSCKQSRDSDWMAPNAGMKLGLGNTKATSSLPRGCAGSADQGRPLWGVENPTWREAALRGVPITYI